MQPAGRAGRGSGDGARLRGARGGPAVDVRRGSARLVRGCPGRVDRRCGPGGGAAAGSGAALARRDHRRHSAGRHHPGTRRARRPADPKAVGQRGPGRAAAPRRAEAAAGHPYAHRLASAGLELCAVRGGPGRRGRAGRRPGHGRGGGRRPRPRPGGRLPAGPGRAQGAAAPADTFSRRPRGGPVRGAARPGRGCDSDHDTGRAARAGRVRSTDRGGRRRARRGGGTGGAPAGRAAGMAGAVAAAGRPATGGGQRRECGPAGARRRPDPAPAGRHGTTRAASPLEGASGAGSGGRTQGRPSRLRTPGPRPARPDPATARDRPGRRGKPLRTPRTGYAHAAAGDGGDRTAHRHRRLDRRHGHGLGSASIQSQPAAKPVRAYRARPFCLPTTRQHDRMRLRQNGPRPHSTGVHQPCSVADGVWSRPELPARTHQRH